MGNDDEVRALFALALELKGGVESYALCLLSRAGKLANIYFPEIGLDDAKSAFISLPSSE